VRGTIAAGAAALFLAACGGAAGAPSAESVSVTPSTASYRLVRVASGLAEPVHLAAPRSEPSRLYVAEQAGVVRVIERGRVRGEPFLDIRRIVGCCGERGLLSIAFHPDYASNRRFYVNFTGRDGHTRVYEYRSDGVRALTRTRRQLLFVRQPYANHNGGQLAFGPDGLLYVGMGDGGSGGDPEDRAQNLSSRLGKLLTLDVDRQGAAPRIVAYGLRNPWRFSFDRLTGDLWIGDVGQGEWEEVDFRPRSELAELANYGWDVFEGRHRYEDKRPNPGGELVGPIWEYDHGSGCSITGGFVYRGSRVADAVGRYFVGDYCSGLVWSLAEQDGRVSGVRRERFTVPALTSFGEDARGELYLVSHNGTIYRLAP
jgi:glucose/arabinose dehydrogenase